MSTRDNAALEGEIFALNQISIAIFVVIARHFGKEEAEKLVEEYTDVLTGRVRWFSAFDAAMERVGVPQSSKQEFGKAFHATVDSHVDAVEKHVKEDQITI